MAKRFFKTALLLSTVCSGTVVVSAVELAPYSDRSATKLPFDGIVLAQAQGTTPTDQSPETELAEEGRSDFLEDLVSEFLEDPSAFLANPNNADIIADIVRRAIARNIANADAVIAAVDGLSEPNIVNAVADGIARAAADYAAAGDTVASSQILAKASIATSTVLQQAVRDKAGEIATEMAGDTPNLQDDDFAPSDQEIPADTQERVLIEETEASLSEAEALTEPAAETPSLSNATGASFDSGSTTSPSDGAISPPPSTGTISPPTTVTPPPPGDPASPA